MTQEDEEDVKNNNICPVYEKTLNLIKNRDHCLLTGKYRSPAQSICNVYVTQKQSNFLPFLFHNFSSYDCHMFFETLVDKENDKVKFDKIPKTNEEYISVTYGFIRFLDSCRLLSISLDI